MKNKNLYNIIIGFCLPLNFIILFVGIFIGDPFAVVLACLSTGLVLLPILQEQENDKEEDKEDKTKED